MGRRRSSLDPGYGERLKRARNAAGLKQTDLADIVDVREFTLSRYENEVIAPDRCFLAGLEYLTGIQRAWVEKGQEPMLRRPAANSGASAFALDRLEEELAGPGGRVIPYPPASGLMGMKPGDQLLLGGDEIPLVEGTLFLVEVDLKPVVGTARKGPAGWFLYHEADLERPGQFPPTPVTKPVGVKIVAKITFTT